MKRRSLQLVGADGAIVNVSLERSGSGWEVSVYDRTGSQLAWGLAPTFDEAVGLVGDELVAAASAYLGS